MGLFSSAQELLYPIYGAMQKLSSGNGVRCVNDSKGRVTLYSKMLASGNLAELAFDIQSMAARAATTEAAARALVEEMRTATGQLVNIDPNNNWPRVGFSKIAHVVVVAEQLSAFFNSSSNVPRTMGIGRSMQVSSGVYFVGAGQAEIRPIFQKNRDTGQGSYRVYPDGGNNKNNDLKIISHEDLAYHAKSGSSIRCLLPSGASSNRSLNSKDVIGLVIDGAYIPSTLPAGRSARDRGLPVEELRKVTADYIWKAVQGLLAGVQAEDFGASVDYDLLVEDGARLAPKQVFGLAASDALGFSVKPFHFTAGANTVCFQLLEDAGYRIVPKDSDPVPIDVPAEQEQREWAEGSPRLVSHFRRERAAGLANAKKAEFRKQHGRLFCEGCKFEPFETYGVYAEACIEVHHNAVRIADMNPGQKTTLDDLQCLCANCHRVLHRQLAVAVDRVT